ncbi:phage distal tail protein, Rcc01695 family [Terrihabitans sp. B22-R8]|uniref:phage distal tail protein, Rcc01695 family n=1 Tax=Terrihabitans sp. B22-R8 TaxID=3425128 RepID=UPI00403C333F
MAAFHEVRFPLDVALGARGGPERRTEIVTLGSGREQRNARWAHARRRWDAGWGVKNLAALSLVVAFFEERRGQLHGFRWRDRLDHSSAAPGEVVSPFDQMLGAGDGETTSFPLGKTYGSGADPYRRPIVKPVMHSVRIGVNGVEAEAGFSVDEITGTVTFEDAPTAGAVLTAGFQFDVPVRFDTDFLEVDLAAFEAGTIPSIPVIEIRP